MTEDEIIEMATQVYGECDWHESALLHLERFAKLVVAKERRECAKLAAEVGYWGLVNEIEAKRLFAIRTFQQA